MAKTGKDDITKTKEVLFHMTNNVNNVLCFTAENQLEYEGGYIQTSEFQLNNKKFIK